MKNFIKHSIVLSAAPIMVVVWTAGCASSPQTNPHTAQKDQAQIERRLNEIFDAAEKKDLERLDSYHLYGPNFTKFAASSAGRLDAAAGRKGEHDGLSAIKDLMMQAEELKVDVFGDVAVATFTLKSSFKLATDTIEKKEHATLVFVKEQGSWKITHEHFSPIKATP
jgi:ketosteroid isomerase-like protein